MTGVFTRAPRLAALLVLALALAGCQLFHPRGAGPATVTQAGGVTVQFSGVTGFSRADLDDALFDAFDAIKTQGLTPATADDAAFFLELFYRKNGYVFVNISYDIPNSQLLQLKVSEGPLVVLGDIKFTGNDRYPAPGNFQEYIIGQTRERFPASRKDLPYVETDVQKGTDLIQRFYLSQGYLEARIGTPSVEFVNDRTRADLIVPIVEGKQYRFGSVVLDGNLVFPERQMRGLIESEIPMPYTRPRVEEMQRRLEDYYKKHGYYTAAMTYTSDPAKAGPDNRVDTVYTVNAGPLFRFGGVRVVGTDRLKPEFLRNRFKKLRGQVYDPQTLDDFYQQMIRTGLFAQLRVEPAPQPDNTLRLDIGVKEAKARELGFSLGYSTFEGALFGFEIRDRDFNGTGRPISLTVDYSTRTLSGELLYVDSHLFESDYEMRLRLNALTRDLKSYQKQEFSGLIDFSRFLTKQLKLSAFAEVDNVKITKHTVQTFFLGLPKYNADLLGATFALDLRDSPVTPTKGLIVTGALDVADKSFGGDLNFVRGTGRITYFQPIGKKSLFIIGARVGIIQPFGTTNGFIYARTDTDPKTPGVPVGTVLPIDERFFLGGSTSVRSFVERELGPYDPRSKQPVGGQAFTLFNAEYQFPLYGADLKGAVFVDAGNLKTRAQDFGLANERYAVGAGIRYNLPIGPLRIDYGVNPDPHGKEYNGAFQFSFGFAF